MALYMQVFDRFCMLFRIQNDLADNFRYNILEDGDIKIQSRQTFHTKEPTMSTKTTSSQEPSRDS